MDIQLNDHEIAKALRDRFESDAILGARALPIRMPSNTIASTTSPVSPAPTNIPITQNVRTAAPALPDLPTLATPPALSPDDFNERTVQLSVIDTNEVKPCTRCGLHATRKKTVFGVGSVAARIMFVGEGPGADEDATGVPFVGRAGELLTKMIEAGMGLRRDDVYICNVVKCRPPNNRTPMPDEIAMCKGYLWRQVEIIKPQVLIALGAPAAQTLLNTRDGIGRLRGQWHDFYPSGSSLIGEPIPLMPTFHPAYLLRSPDEKPKAWSDLKMVMTRLGLTIPAKK